MRTHGTHYYADSRSQQPEEYIELRALESPHTDNGNPDENDDKGKDGLDTAAKDDELRASMAREKPKTHFSTLIREVMYGQKCESQDTLPTPPIDDQETRALTPVGNQGHDVPAAPKHFDAATRSDKRISQASTYSDDDAWIGQRERDRAAVRAAVEKAIEKKSSKFKSWAKEERWKFILDQRSIKLREREERFNKNRTQGSVEQLFLSHHDEGKELQWARKVFKKHLDKDAERTGSEQSYNHPQHQTRSYEDEDEDDEETVPIKQEAIKQESTEDDSANGDIDPTAATVPVLRRQAVIKAKSKKPEKQVSDGPTASYYMLPTSSDDSSKQERLDEILPCSVITRGYNSNIAIATDELPARVKYKYANGQIIECTPRCWRWNGAEMIEWPSIEMLPPPVVVREAFASNKRKAEEDVVNEERLKRIKD